MAKTICITNQKGGVGKTTTTGCLAACLKQKGFKVLCIDLDPQGNLSFSCGVNSEGSASIYEVLTGECKTNFAVRPTTSFFDIIPSNLLLSGIEIEYTGSGREYLLKNALSIISDRYDYILIDTPPALSILTVNALAACDIVIIPMLADIFSLQGIAKLADTIARVRAYVNPDIKVEGILLTKYNPRTILSKEIKATTAMVASEMKTKVFKTTIRTSVVLMEAQANQESILKYQSKNTAIEDYMNLADELLENRSLIDQ